MKKGVWYNEKGYLRQKRMTLDAMKKKFWDNKETNTWNKEVDLQQCTRPKLVNGLRLEAMKET